MIYTKGRVFNPSFYLPLTYFKGTFKNIFPINYLSILFYSENNSYFLELLNSEDIILKDYKELEQLIFFPRIINSEYNFENIKKDDNFDNNSKLDLFLIKPFLKNNKTKIYLTFEQKENIKNYFKELYIQLKIQKDDLWPCHSKKTFYQLLFYIETLLENSSHSNSLSNIDVEKLENHLKCNYSQKINLTKLIPTLGTNRTTLYKNFKLKHNITILTYLTKIRISMACKLLLETSSPIEEIMYSTGFNNYSNFIKQFKKEQKIAPNSYRYLNKSSF
ncbi:MAG: helix-turn-helix domain-containing protein [Fusobacteriaceae bacterium]